jgi:N-acetylneuraminic acid mutarotase
MEVENIMRSRLLVPALLTLSALGLVACAEEATAPNAAEDQATLPQLAAVSNTWLSRRVMPLELLSQAAATVPNAEGQSIVYAIGGRKLDRMPPVPVGEVRAYNVATNTWTSKQDMPVARYGMNGAGVIDGKIYVTGGFTDRYKPHASLFVYDPATNTWTRKRDMPAAGGGGMSAVIRGRLYVVTFSPGLPDTVANFFRYNPTTDSWTKLPSPSNYSRLDVGGGVVNNKLYLIGPRVLEYDPVTDQWTKKGSFGSGLEGPTVVLLGRLYVFGATLNAGGVPSPAIIVYDPVSDSWEKKPLLITRFGYWGPTELAATRVFLNGQPRIEVVGGSRTYEVRNNLQYIP